MDFVMKAILTTLRMSDVFCQYSSVQYLILLPSASLENGKKVVDRILQRFHIQHPKVSYTVKYTLLDVLPQYHKTRNERSN